MTDETTNPTDDVDEPEDEDIHVPDDEEPIPGAALEGGDDHDADAEDDELPPATLDVPPEATGAVDENAGNDVATEPWVGDPEDES